MGRKKKTPSNPQDKWSQPQNPPPPLFLGKKERDLTKQVNDELIERVIGQTLIYYPLSVEHTNFHPLYGEAIEKTYLRPIIIKALVKWEGEETSANSYGLDKEAKITINFHRRRLTEDQDLFIREGDIVFYGLRFYEIVKLVEPKLLFGQSDQKFEIQATCKRARQGFFEEKLDILNAREAIRNTSASTQQQVIEAITSACQGKIQFISGRRTSSQRSQFLDYVNNPQTYEGCIVYLTEIDEDEIYGDFDQADKFYFNEDGSWYVSQFFSL
jgi:hypothetical protein